MPAQTNINGDVNISGNARINGETIVRDVSVVDDNGNEVYALNERLIDIENRLSALE